MSDGIEPDGIALESRRDFLKQGAAVAAALAGGQLLGCARSGGAEASEAAEGGVLAAGEIAPDPSLPWYRRCVRWGQTNIAEIDPGRYDLDFWRKHWKRTRVQGIVVNAGGIVAYYPTEIPHHRRAVGLGDRDLFGDLRKVAREEGLAVFARMDCRAGEELYQAEPDWFCRDASGNPYRSDRLIVACVNGPYFSQHIPSILREVATKYKPEGFTDNSWSGLTRNNICFCDNCTTKFKAAFGADLPRQRDWNNPVYRKWIGWNYARRLEIWDEFNKVVRDAGGPDCLWVGMNGGSAAGEAGQFRDLRGICKKAELIMLDDQRRMDATGFQRNGEVGKLVHSVLGWDKIMPESMAMYQTTSPTFRNGAKPAAEARMWMLEGFAGGIQPWWHHVSAYQEDRRQFETTPPVMQWHAANEAYLRNRRPVATVGVVWSLANIDFFGRDQTAAVVEQPANGILQALVRARIPSLPVHIDDLESDGGQFKLLILPNVGAMSDAQAETIRKFVRNGGGLVATGWTSLFDAWGDVRPDFALADLFGAHLPANHGARNETTRNRWTRGGEHTYLRLTPELRALGDGPHAPDEPKPEGTRHPVLRGFDATDILGYGGALEAMQVDSSAKALLTFIPPYPVSPPEDCWMRTPKTDIPGLIVNEPAGGGRVVYLPADLDRRFSEDNLPDHGDLLANCIFWAAKENIPVRVEGSGLIDVHLYRQPGRLILHLINLTSAGTWRAPVHELIPVGPLRAHVQLPEDVKGRRIRSLVSGQSHAALPRDGWSMFDVKSILDHEAFIIE